MRYTEPIKDRTATDITNKTAKAFFNIADWQRIYNNTQITKALVDFLLSINVTFDTLTTPTITTIPTVAQLNTLLANIERIRLAVEPTVTGLSIIKDDWEYGFGKESPDYLNVNDWENVLDVIYNTIGAESGYTGWMPDSGSPVRRARAGVATSGTGLTRNNYFRRYA